MPKDSLTLAFEFGDKERLEKQYMKMENNPKIDVLGSWGYYVEKSKAIKEVSIPIFK